MSDSTIRHLNISDLERIARFRHAGYGGSVSDALQRLGVLDTIFSSQFKPLRQGMQLVGRALPVKLHSFAGSATPEAEEERLRKWEAEGGHPQKRMMRAVDAAEDGCVLCFDCGGDMQPAHFGEMSCQLFWLVMLPLARPMLATVALFSFIGSWNDFLVPLAFTFAQSNMRTLAVGMYAFVGENSTNWTYMCAGSVITLGPIMLVFALLQRHFISAFQGAIKG